MDPGWRRQRSRVRAQGRELGSAGPSSQPLPQPSKGQIHRLTSQRQQLAPKGGCGRNFSPTASSSARELISHEGKPERGTKEAGEAAGGLREPRPGRARAPRDATPGPGSPWSSPPGGFGSLSPFPTCSRSCRRAGGLWYGGYSPSYRDTAGFIQENAGFKIVSGEIGFQQL